MPYPAEGHQLVYEVKIFIADLQSPPHVAYRTAMHCTALPDAMVHMQILQHCCKLVNTLLKLCYDVHTPTDVASGTHL